jgi:hypothetical protein
MTPTSCWALGPDETWHVDDMAVDCASGLHSFFLALGVVSILVYPIGIPLVFLFLLHRNDKKDVTPENRNQYWYWSRCRRARIKSVWFHRSRVFGFTLNEKCEDCVRDNEKLKKEFEQGKFGCLFIFESSEEGYELAATKIQTQYRGNTSRINASIKALKLSKSEEEYELAATKIQTQYRGNTSKINASIKALKLSKLDVSETKTKGSSYAFLKKDYKRKYYYFECVTLIEKLLLTGLLVFVEQGSIFQCFVGACIACAFLAVQLKFWPYNEHTDNVLKAVAEGQLFITLLLSIVLRFSEEELDDDALDADQYGTILVVAFLSAPSVAAIFTIRTIYQVVRDRPKCDNCFCKFLHSVFCNKKVGVVSPILDKTGLAPRSAAVDRNAHGSTFDLENTPEAVVLPGSTSTVALASTSEVFSKDFIDESPSLSMDLDMDKQTRLPPLVTAAEYFPTPSPSTTTTTTTTTSDAPPLDQLSSDLADFLAEDEVNSTKLDVAGVTEFSTSADKYRQNER